MCAYIDHDNVDDDDDGVDDDDDGESMDKIGVLFVVDGKCTMSDKVEKYIYVCIPTLN